MWATSQGLGNMLGAKMAAFVEITESQRWYVVMK